MRTDTIKLNKIAPIFTFELHLYETRQFFEIIYRTTYLFRMKQMKSNEPQKLTVDIQL